MRKHYPHAHRATNLILVLCAVCLPAVLSVSCSKPSPGLLKLQRSRAAIRAAQSWREDVGMQIPSGQYVMVSIEKVECPGRYDRFTMVRGPQNHSVHEIMYDGVYYNKSDAIDWLKTPGAQITAMTCGEGPSLIWDGVLYDDLDTVQRSGEVRPGKPPQPLGNACEWWEVAPSKGAPPHYMVCINPDDYLPHIVHSREHDLDYAYTLSGWNTTKVVLPENLPAAAN